ncbi:Dna2/Cas4 domain-containing protein [bacterium]|nr:Dna2/Cas4 domain-containing protein [bacterium]
MKLPQTLVIVLLIVIVIALIQRRKSGFGFGKTISHDDLTLKSKHYGLIGKPDRIVEYRGKYIPEEKKTAFRFQDSFRAQMGVYFILIEDHFGIRPPYGYIVLGNGKRVCVKNTAELRELVLASAEQIRELRHQSNSPLEPIGVNSKQCLRCGQRENCTVRLA